jgi:phosphoribosylaminoimidazole-succinocarboxamide synthase
MSSLVLFSSNLTGLELMSRGKVRDIYHVDDEYILIITTDRLSAFDVVLPQPIPKKGEVLTRMSDFWFHQMSHIIAGQCTDISLEEVVTSADKRDALGDRARVVRRFKPLPIEAICRGYLIGSGWKDYQANGAVCGINLPSGLRQAQQLPEPIFTPSTKADVGEHDENVRFDYVVQCIGSKLAYQIRDVSLSIYKRASEYARVHGIIIADTKFEFGLDDKGKLHLIDEVLTPDSSRFWPVDQYEVGTSPPSFDKQFVRDYLESVKWDKRPPAPELPDDIIERTASKYKEVEKRLMVNNT